MTGQVASVIAALFTGAGLLLAFFKFKPGEKITTDMNVAQAQIDVATGALKLVTSGLTEEIDRLTKKVHNLNQEVDRLKSELEQCRLHHGSSSTANR